MPSPGRKSISVTGKTYRRLRAFCRERRMSGGEVVEIVTRDIGHMAGGVGCGEGVDPDQHGAIG